jgi:hypothetical protein
MSKKLLTLLAGAALVVASAALSLGQQPTTKTQTPTTVTKTVQNPDGTFTVIEYPVGKEVQVVLTPVTISNAEGVATILRDDAGTRIKLNLNKVPAEVTTVNLYAVDDTGAVTSLGPITVTNGAATFTGTTPLSKFMLIASPEATLTTYDANTKVLFRSAAPEGYAVIPRAVDVQGEKVAATTTNTPVTASAYTVPMLNIPAFKTGDDTKMKVKLSGPLTGARANVFLKPRKDGPTEVRIRFHELKDAPAGRIYEVWAVSADNKFIKLGQIANVKGRNEAEIRSEVALPDFGLLITEEESTSDLMGPKGTSIGIVELTP